MRARERDVDVESSSVPSVIGYGTCNKSKTFPEGMCTCVHVLYTKTTCSKKSENKKIPETQNKENKKICTTLARGLGVAQSCKNVKTKIKLK